MVGMKAQALGYKPLSDAMKNEIKRKAVAGKELTDKSNKAAVALYNQYKKEATALTKDLKPEKTMIEKLEKVPRSAETLAYGMGGADYNKVKKDSNLTGEKTQKQMEYDERVRRTNPEFVKSEIERTNEVIRARKKKNLNTSSQEKYLKQLGTYSTANTRGRPSK
jgi:hypothetical protein